MKGIFSISFLLLQSLRPSSTQGSCCSLKLAYYFQFSSGIITSVLYHVANCFQQQKLWWKTSDEVTIRVQLCLGWAAVISFSQGRNCQSEDRVDPTLNLHQSLEVIYYFMSEQSSLIQSTFSQSNTIRSAT